MFSRRYWSCIQDFQRQLDGSSYCSGHVFSKFSKTLISHFQSSKVSIFQSVNLSQFLCFKISEVKKCLNVKFQSFKNLGTNNSNIFERWDFPTYRNHISYKHNSCSRPFKIFLQYIRGPRSSIWSTFGNFQKMPTIVLQTFPKHS